MRMVSKFELETIRAQSSSLTDFAERVGMSVPTLCRQLKMYDIQTSFREAGSNLRITEQEAYNLYVFEKKSLREIARMYNVSHQAVSQWLDVYGIAKRNASDPTIKKVRVAKQKAKREKEKKKNQADENN